jgi:hypothetical protein
MKSESLDQTTLCRLSSYHAYFFENLQSELSHRKTKEWLNNTHDMAIMTSNIVSNANYLYTHF